MDFELTEEQRLIRDTARDFAAREIAPKAAELDKTGALADRDRRSKMAELGFLGVAIPQEHGGAGMDTRQLRARDGGDQRRVRVAAASS